MKSHERPCLTIRADLRDFSRKLIAIAINDSSIINHEESVKRTLMLLTASLKLEESTFAVPACIHSHSLPTRPKQKEACAQPPARQSLTVPKPTAKSSKTKPNRREGPRKGNCETLIPNKWQARFYATWDWNS